MARFRDLGLTRTIATSSKADALQALLEQANVADLIDEETTSNDAERSKPAPDIVASALEEEQARGR